MGFLKRLCLFVFGLAGIVCIAVFALPLFGIAVAPIKQLLALSWGKSIVLGCAALAGVGLLICMGVALFAPRNARAVVVSTSGGDTIQISREAIRAQATHIVESDGSLSARSVNVKARKRGHVRIAVRVQPHSVVNVVTRGAELHDQLIEGLSEICGNTVDKVEIEFIDAASHDEPMSFERLQESYAAQDEAQPSYSASSIVLAEQPAANDITVPMGHAVVSNGEERDGLDVSMFAAEGDETQGEE